VIALVAVLTAATAACAGDEASNAGSGTQQSSPTASALSRESLSTVAQYTGVPPGKATGQPIKIGFVNADSQELTIATDEIVRAVNEQFGGVKGRPLQLVKCVVTKSEEAQTCAQQFVADPAMVAVVQGTMDVDVLGFHTTLSPKLPVLGGLPLAVADAGAPNSYYLSSGQFGGLGAVTFAKDYSKARRVAVLYPADSPANELAITTLRDALKAENIQVTVAKFPLDATDMTQAVTESQAAAADLLIPAVGIPQHCVALSNTLQKMAVYTPVLTFAGCLGGDVRKTLGDYPRWNYLGFSVSAEASSSDDFTAWQVRAFNEWYKPMESRGVTRNGAVQTFQTMLTLVKILASVGGDQITPTAAGNAMKKFKGPVFLGVPTLSFGAVPQMPAIGSLSSRVYVYLGNVNWRDTTRGEWISPPVPNPNRGQTQGGGQSQSPSSGTRNNG
jgi:ABC-type branched-subunit amino acid transport system substrate-binding protein